jgi:protein-S-isoprenylcysteine O-methyltransferase Ste14
VKQKFWIDTHKAATGPFVLALIAGYHAWQSVWAWVYLAIHGTYGALWVLKSHYFGDKQWEQQASLGYGLFIWFGLSLYWIAPWLIVSGHATEPPAWYIGVCIIVYSFGVFFHFASDMQKHMSLAHRRGTLLTDGLWGNLRNPNYFGELLINVSFSLLAHHWIPFVVLGAFIAAIWVPNMRKKDKSLSRYPEFAQYKANSKLFIPYLI